ncbi:MAG: hypothetical protein HQ568_09175 [Calditrichaeota bacterium]|nr:hypothetical protein [Calditrichota bacterium]
MGIYASQDWIIERLIAEGLHINEKDQLVLSNGLRRKGRISIKADLYRRLYVKIVGKRYRLRLSRVHCWLANGRPKSFRFVVDFVNGDRDDYRPANVSWVTLADRTHNTSCSVQQARLERLQLASAANRIREHVPRKLSFEKAEIIRQRYLSGRVTIIKLAEEYGMSRYAISDVVNH